MDCRFVVNRVLGRLVAAVSTSGVTALPSKTQRPVASCAGSRSRMWCGRVVAISKLRRRVRMGTCRQSVRSLISGFKTVPLGRSKRTQHGAVT